MIIDGFSDVEIVLRHPTLLDIASAATKREIIASHPEYIQYMKKPSREYQLMAIHQDPNVIQFINKPCDEVLLYGIIFNDLDDFNTPDKIEHVLIKLLETLLKSGIGKMKLLKMVIKFIFKKVNTH